MLRLLLFIAVTLPALRAQLIDFSDGDASDVESCDEISFPGKWTLQPASDYPPLIGKKVLSGTVYTSSDHNNSCFTTSPTLYVSENSYFRMLVYFPSTTPYDHLEVDIFFKGGEAYRIYKLHGPNPAGWVVIEEPIPSRFYRDDCRVQIMDISYPETMGTSISIRYFEVTNQPRTTSPPSTCKASLTRHEKSRQP